MIAPAKGPSTPEGRPHSADTGYSRDKMEMSFTGDAELPVRTVSASRCVIH